MKIELEIPYVDDELSIKITIKKDGVAVIEKPSVAAAPAPVIPKAQSKKKTTSTPPIGGNFMNADF